MTRIVVVAALFLVFAFSMFGYALHRDTSRAREARHELCEALDKANHANRELWLRVIARSRDAQPDQVAAFVKDLNHFFPHTNCEEI